MHQGYLRVAAIIGTAAMSFLGKIGNMIGGSAQSTVAATTARSVAKERLSVILASQRGSELLEGVDMEALQQDVLGVVKVSAG